MAVIIVTISAGLTTTGGSKAATAVGDINQDGIVNVFDLSILLNNWGLSSTPTPTATVTPTPTPTPTGGTGRTYPMHTNIVSTMFWVGEAFQDTADGSQVCSAYDSEWQYSFFHLRLGTNTAVGCNGAPTGGCDALRTNASGACSSPNAYASLRTPANNYTAPAGQPAIYENPFYLDLPYDDYNSSGGGETTGYSRRCTDIPWANDPGYAGHCTDRSFSYMKNRWVKLWVGTKVCYGQIEDAGPADSGNGNGNYADYPYVFGANDARPFNKSYGGAGADVSPALGSCLGMGFDDSITLNWQFVDEVAVPAGPWKTKITTTPPN